MSVVKVKPDAYTKDTDLKNLCAYIVNPEGTVEGDYTNAVSNYTYFEKEMGALISR